MSELDKLYNDIATKRKAADPDKLLTEKYKLLMYTVHSLLEQWRDELSFSHLTTTVENFQDVTVNRDVCRKISALILEHFNYELSHNQMCNGINLFLKCNK